MTQQEEARIAQAVYQALDGQNFAAAVALLDDSSMLHVPGRSGLAGDYQGREAILGLLEQTANLTRGSLRLSPAQIADSAGPPAAVRGRAEAWRQGRRLDTDIEIAVSIGDGVVREIWISHDNQSHVDEFWS